MNESRDRGGTPDAGQEPAPLKVSVLIVSHDNVAALRECLQALESSKDRAAFEILVVDNGSRDECPQIDSEFPGVTVLRLPRYFGATKAMNIGTRTAAGEYIFLLHPETVVTPETVSTLAALLDADSDVVAVCPLLVDPEGEPLPFLRRIPTPATLARAWRHNGDLDPVTVNFDAEPVPVEYPGRGALLARKQFIKGMNYFDEHFGEFWADAELCYQIHRNQKKTLLVPAIRVVHHPVPAIDDYPPDARAILSADCAAGAATFVRKHYGFFGGLRFRLGIVFTALGQALASLLSFRDVGFYWSRFFAVATGQKIDGFQSAL
ncbi:MAG: glycosyltransferase family 2 protein [Pseudomonadota bacterium]